MPYKRIGKIVYHKIGRGWTIKQKCHSIPKAMRAIRLLYGIENGMTLRKRVITIKKIRRR